MKKFLQNLNGSTKSLASSQTTTKSKTAETRRDRISFAPKLAALTYIPSPEISFFDEEDNEAEL